MFSTISTPVGAPTTPPSRAVTAALVSAWSIPVLLLGQFALLASLPVVVVLAVSLRSARLRGLRWWSGLLALLYAAPMAIWLFRPDGAQSLSKDISPVFVALIIAASAVLIVKLHLARSR
ncbi:hypothetical protein EV379_1548 [Microterricola gilva]|uniref:Uncharacterized protein n=1 Tax=Microterricola gilva TaxID=393267 RepID=A0A4Q8AMJ1_9MICO|nr:hypothetical protein [Microterricola gilva]RZU65223.1 hypothetical protein EV379_1548 [Microterricola gilva]